MSFLSWLAPLMAPNKGKSKTLRGGGYIPSPNPVPPPAPKPFPSPPPIPHSSTPVHYGLQSTGATTHKQNSNPTLTSLQNAVMIRAQKNSSAYLKYQIKKLQHTRKQGSFQNAYLQNPYSQPISPYHSHSHSYSFKSNPPKSSVPNPIVSGVSAPITGLVNWGVSGVSFATGVYPSKSPKVNPTIPPQSFHLDQPVDYLQQQLSPHMLSQLTMGGKNLLLKQSDYKASGGEGVVYVKGGYAYKIYHDASKMIPVGKIQELSALTMPTILGPKQVIYHNNVPVGFAMAYVSDTEFLCKLFTKGFRDKMGVTPDQINVLVKGMQDTLHGIHDKDILVVDYNEMNFLVNRGFDTVYNIDVDSYQTPSYPATAIMESIRDRQVKGGKFTKESDWFSFACVAFQLYMGTHPYKGRHPDFAAKDWMDMMNKNISVFNKKCKLPPATQGFDVIPKGHLRWFESVFERGERGAPPDPDSIQIVTGPVKAKIIDSTDKFNVTLVEKFDSPIEAFRYVDGVPYFATQTGIYASKKQFASFARQSGYVAKRTVRDFVACAGGLAVILEHNSLENKLRFKTIEGVDISEVDADGFFVANRAAYAVVRNSLIEISFIHGDKKITASQNLVANIFHNHQVFDGMVVQNMLDTCRLAIPFAPGKCSIIRINELDKYRIIDAKYDSGVAIVLAEQGGKYHRFTLIFNKEATTYTVRIDNDVPLQDINFIIKDNGVCISSNDDKLEIFADNTKVKLVDSPLNNNEVLASYKNDTYVINGDGLYKISSK